jgi:hypothetical protein
MGLPSDFTLPKLASLGVRRESVGGALARAAWGGFVQAAQCLYAGRFDDLTGALPGAQLNGLVKEEP